MTVSCLVLVWISWGHSIPFAVTSAVNAQQKRLKRLFTWLEAVWYAEGGTRTPMPIKAQRPERCVSTNFTTSARFVTSGQTPYYRISLQLSTALNFQIPDLLNFFSNSQNISCLLRNFIL
jgi:hypothetical protein